MNPAQRDDDYIESCVGPGTPTTEWAETAVKAWKKHSLRVPNTAFPSQQD